ncbi:MAG: hypothetical protein HOC02_09860 [Methylococcales bacterium]|mgnify:FL=1|jgi:hypothetical protein|nr:hypothetical protein [Methylococcales bacterium]
MTIKYDTVKTAHVENRLPTETKNWILSPDRLARNKSIITINSVMLQHNPNHRFSDRELRLLCKVKTELEHHFKVEIGVDL